MSSGSGSGGNNHTAGGAAGLPPQVAAELAGYLRSSLFTPLSSNITRLRQECEASMATQKDLVQDVQTQISDVIEPTAEKLIPIAEELKDVYRQIELLEAMVARTGESIKQMTSKVETTEAALRREERALNDGRPLAMWKEPEQVKMFRAKEFIEGGRMKDPAVSPPARTGTPVMAS